MTAMRALFFSVLLLVGCTFAGSYDYTPTTRYLAAAKRLSCGFDLLTARPERSFVELGVLERPPGPRAPAARSASDFRESVGLEVCRAGGDAVLAEVTGFGAYIRGTVIRYKDRTDQPDEAAQAEAPPVATRPSPGMSHAIVRASTAEIRTAPFNVAPVVTVLAGGQALLVGSVATDGWRRATLPDGRFGYVQDAQLQTEASSNP